MVQSLDQFTVIIMVNQNGQYITFLPPNNQKRPYWSLAFHLYCCSAIVDICSISER